MKKLKLDSKKLHLVKTKIAELNQKEAKQIIGGSKGLEIKGNTIFFNEDDASNVPGGCQSKTV